MKRRQSRLRRFAIVVLIVPALWLASSLATTNFPPVVVTAPRIGGGNILCTGDACSAILASMANGINMENLTQGFPLEDNPPLPGPQFCSNLKADKPAGCNGASPPPSPGINVPGQAAWQPNGCGTGGVGGWFQDAVLEVFMSQSYSDDINSPYPGVSFLSACNLHDECWASGENRTQCDMGIQAAMNSACDQQLPAGSSGWGTCRGFSSNYHGALSTTNGSHSAHATSSGARECALWAHNMRENSCAF